MTDADNGRGAACIACGQTATSPRHRIGQFAYVGCDGCGLWWLDPLPAPTDAEAQYDGAYFTGRRTGGYADYGASEPVHRRNARARLALIAHHRPRAASILDIGCAHGFLLDEARRRGWRVAGVDVSAFTRDEARQRFGLTVHAALEQIPETARYDVVSMFQVLEHLARPEPALRAAHRRVAPGGILVIETWDRGSRAARVFGRHWQQLSPPSVVYVFNRPSLRRLLAGSGYTVESIAPTAKRVRLGEVHHLIVGKYPEFERIDRLIPHRVREAVVPYRMGDLITVVAAPRSAAD